MRKKTVQGRTARRELIPFVRQVLRNQHVWYKISDDGKVFTDLSSNSYHRIIERAMCLQQQGDSPIPVISFGEYLHEKRPRCFSILEKDKVKYLAEVIA